MTLIPLLVTNGDFLFTIRVWDSFRFVTIQFGTVMVLVLYRFGTGPILVLYKFGTGLVLVLYKFSLEFWSFGVLEWSHFGTCST